MADERDRPDAKCRREQLRGFQGWASPHKDGWGLKGNRVHGSAPFGYWGTSTFTAAQREDRTDVPWALDGTVNGDVFRVYVET